MDNDARAEKVNSALKAFLTQSLAGSICNFEPSVAEKNLNSECVSTPPRNNSEAENVNKSSALVVPPATPSEEKPRRFTEGPVNKKRSRWREDSQASCPPIEGYEEPQAKEGLDPLTLAVKRAKEAVSCLGEYDPNSKDTYVDAVEAGGMIDGGTWEHRKRGKEMVNTAQISQLINELHKRKCHVGNVIPPEALQTLVEAPKEDEEDASEGLKLDSSNKGFQLLQKAGWSCGEGLGPSGEGITEPIPGKQTTVIEEKPTAEENEDPFAQYRRRMMLAYRFRPNPLNNPRRSYDGYATIYDSTSIDNVIRGISSENQFNK